MLRVTDDGWFLSPPGGGRPLLAAAVERAEEVPALAAAGAGAGLVRRPAPPGVVEALEAAGLAVVAEGAATDAAARGVDLWLAGDGVRPPGGALVAGPVLDPRTGACAGDVAAGAIPRDPRRAVAATIDLQLAARRRPVLVRVDGEGDGVTALERAADLGAAVLVVPGEGEERLRAVARLAERERRRLDEAPPLSVVVCVYNAAAYLDACLASLAALEHPRYEVLVVDDGSTDGSLAIARRHGVEVVALRHAGVSAARNAGVAAARGEVVAFLDADEEATPWWPKLLWRGMEATGADAVSGPNLPYATDGLQARAVSALPGAAVPVVEPGGVAEHLTCCNLAARRELLREVPFDESRAAGEDVAFTFAARDRGARLYYLPTAAVHHHRRPTVAGYLRQQASYGEALTEDLAGRFTAPARRRAGLLRRRHVFSGSDAAQLYAQTAYPVEAGLPLRLLLAAGAAGAAGCALAPAGARRRWCAGTLAAVGGVLAWVVASVPVFAPRPGLSGAWQRVLTAVVWLLRPAARELGRRRAARGAPRDPVSRPHR